MKILALDTSTIACSVALQNGDDIKVLHKIAPLQQAQLILPMIHTLLDSFSLTPDNLDAIAYGCGPGSFTGIRIANSVAQGLGFAAQKPIIRISSLAVLAQTIFLERQCTQILVAVDARMRQVYWAIYEVKQTGCVALIGEERVCSPEDVNLPKEGNWCGVGDGFEKYKINLMMRLDLRPDAIYPSQLPTAFALLHLARKNFEQKEYITASQAAPVYLR